MDKILLIDGNSFFYRSYHASQRIPNYYTHNNSKAVYTAIRTLKKFLTQQESYHSIFVAFDLGKNTLRHQQFVEYKINRKKTPDDLIEQIPIFEEFLTLMEIDILKNSLYEADDLVATLCFKGLNKGFGVDVFSNDSDLLQLVNENVNVFISKKGASEIEMIDSVNFFTKFGIQPQQVVDFKSLVGDSSDNLPGVKGVGPKTALKLLNRFSTLEKIYQSLNQIDAAVAARLQNSKTEAFFTKRMATICQQIPLEVTFVKKKYDFNSANVEDFYTKYHMNSLLKTHKQRKFRY